MPCQTGQKIPSLDRPRPVRDLRQRRRKRPLFPLKESQRMVNLVLLERTSAQAGCLLSGWGNQCGASPHRGGWSSAYFAPRGGVRKQAGLA